MHGVYWTGPVSPHNLDSVKWTAPTQVVVVSKGVCSKGDPKCVSWTSFTDLAKSLPGNKLAALDVAASAPGPFATRTLCGFSAGGALLEALLTDKQTAPSIDAVLGLDCFYFKGDCPGFLAFAQRAAASKAMMVLTTSGAPDAGFVTPSEAVKPFVEKLGAVTLSPSDSEPLLVGMTPRPELVQRVGRFYHFGFGKSLGHVDHAKRAGPAVLQSLISPQMAQQAGSGGWPAPSEGHPWLQAAAAAALLAVAIVVPVAIGKAAERERRGSPRKPFFASEPASVSVPYEYSFGHGRMTPKSMVEVPIAASFGPLLVHETGHAAALGESSEYMGWSVSTMYTGALLHIQSFWKKKDALDYAKHFGAGPMKDLTVRALQERRQAAGGPALRELEQASEKWVDARR